MYVQFSIHIYKFVETVLWYVFLPNNHLSFRHFSFMAIKGKMPNRNMIMCYAITAEKNMVHAVWGDLVVK